MVFSIHDNKYNTIQASSLLSLRLCIRAIMNQM